MKYLALAVIAMALAACTTLVDMILPDMSPPCNASTVGTQWNGKVCSPSLHNDGYDWGR